MRRQKPNEGVASAALIHTHHIFVSGKVQGVFYRKHTTITARELGVTGWVRNLPDSRVEVMAEGTAQQLSALEAWCHRGPPKAVVTSVEVGDVTPTAAVENEAGEEVLVPHRTTRTLAAFEVRR